MNRAPPRRALQSLRPRLSHHRVRIDRPRVSPYAGDNFRSTSPGPRPPSDVGAFLRDNNIGVVIEDERLRKIGRYSRDTEWNRFRAAPGEYGFAVHTLPGTDAILYVRTHLLPRS